MTIEISDEIINGLAVQNNGSGRDNGRNNWAEDNVVGKEKNT